MSLSLGRSPRRRNGGSGGSGSGGAGDREAGRGEGAGPGGKGVLTGPRPPAGGALTWSGSGVLGQVWEA